MQLPANFSGAPTEKPHRYFRNVCIEVRKIIKASKNTNELQVEMAKFIDASKQMHWPHKTSSVYRKDDGEKATKKVLAEFIRYIDSLLTKSPTANPQDLLDSLSEVEQLIYSLQAK